MKKKLPKHIWDCVIQTESGLYFTAWYSDVDSLWYIYRTEKNCESYYFIECATLRPRKWWYIKDLVK